jgi:glycosyltransferase involved in cell wall biosynthesis
VARLNVLHVLNGFVDSSITRIVLWLVESLGTHDTSWHVGAVTGTGDMQDAFRRLDCRVVDFADHDSPRRSIRSYVREQEIDVVHTHTPRTILDAAIALRGTPGVKHITTKHLLNSRADRRWGLAYVLVDRVTLYLPDVVIPVSATMGERLASQPLLDRRKVVVIRNAIPVEHYRAVDRRGPADALVLGYAGRIDKMKRIDLLLEAFREVLAQHPGSHLVIAGEGSLKGEMQTLAMTLGVSHAVTWPGFRRDMPELLAGIDVYVQPSVNEGLSLSVLEAMAAGKAVVATNVGGAGEVIADGKTGILVPPGSSAALAAAILRLLADPAKREAMSQAGRAHVESKFGLQTMVDGYRALYDRLSAAEPARES